MARAPSAHAIACNPHRTQNYSRNGQRQALKARVSARIFFHFRLNESIAHTVSSICSTFSKSAKICSRSSLNTATTSTLPWGR
jgi:hypothetical protein